MLKKLVLGMVALLGLAGQSRGDILYSTVGSTTVIDFTGYTGAGFQSTPTVGQLDSDDWAATGWSDGDLVFGGTRTTASTDYTRGVSNTTESTGGFYAFSNITGTTGTSFGIQPGGSDWAPGTVTLQIRNTTGSTLNSVNIGYDLFVRNDQNRSNSFNLYYTTGTLNTPGSFTNQDAFTSTAAADVVPLGWVNQRSTGTLTTISTTLNNNESIFFRWSGADVGGSGSRDEFAIDNITFSGITAVPEPTTLALVCLIRSTGLVARYRRRKAK